MIWETLAGCLGLHNDFGHVDYIPPGHRCNSTWERQEEK